LKNIYFYHSRFHAYSVNDKLIQGGRLMKKLIQGVLGYGVGSIFILMIVFSGILALLLRFTNMEYSTLNQIALIAGISILAFGGMMAAYKGEQKGWLSGGMTGLIFVAAMALFQIIFENQWVSLPQLSYFGGLLVAAWLGGMIGVNLPRRSAAKR
jgi:putative membrane protein (TIGR04086 family)